MYALGPPQPHFLLHSFARKIQPRFAEIVAKAVGSSRPDQDWRLISHCLEASFAFAQMFFGALTLRDVAVDGVIHELLAGTRCGRNSEKRHINLSPILASANRFDLYSATFLE